ncbi:MAG: SDR family NAD(P)-dependent oxidoreductase, partial [Thermoguttaceae bacterium]|nr:SDR family NAD(P)-dependent oxidoreductase [Thermoguttaceae bacterium]
MKKSYWQQKVVLVTGGSSGLGLEIASAFAEKGARVIIAALEKDAVEAAVRTFQEKSLDVMGFQVNVCLDEDVERLKSEIMARFGRLDVLANVAGRTDRGKMLQCDAGHFAKTMDLNFIALVRVTHAFLPMLLESRGHIINIGSLA